MLFQLQLRLVLFFAVFAINLPITASLDFAPAQRIFNASPNHQVLNDGELKLALNVGSEQVAEVPTLAGNLLFAGAGVSGRTQQTTAGELSVTVETSFQFSRLSDSYSNNAGLQTLFGSAAVSERVGQGEGIIDISIAGLEPGQQYRLQLFHLQPGVNPASREMVLLNRDDTGEYSGFFAPVSEVSGVRTMVLWTAESPTLNLRLLANPQRSAYNRSVLNGLALHAL